MKIKYSCSNCGSGNYDTMEDAENCCPNSYEEEYHCDNCDEAFCDEDDCKEHEEKCGK